MILLPFLLFLTKLNAKYFTKEFTYQNIENASWIYLTKFAAHIGITKYTYKLQFLDVENQPNGSVDIYPQIYLDVGWHEVLKQEPCVRKENALVKWKMEVLTNGSISNVTSRLSQSIRQHLWFFVIDDCARELYTFLKYNPNSKMVVTIEFLNTNDSHFSSEESGIIYFILLLTIIVSITFIQYAKIILSKQAQYEETHWPLIILVTAMLIEIFQNGSLLTHLYMYSQNGIGLPLYQQVSDILQVLSRMILNSLMILISWGWSIEYIRIDKIQLLAFIVGLSQVGIVALDQMNQKEDYNKYHHFDGIAGYSISIIEIALYLYFIYGTKRTYQHSKELIKRFSQKFGFYASFYFLGFPILLLISKILAPYLRYKFVMIGTFSFRILAIQLLAQLFTSNQSGYHKIYYDNKPILDESTFKYA